MAETVADIVKEGFGIIRQVNQLGEAPELAEKFSQCLAKLTTHTEIEAIRLSTLLAQLGCAHDFTLTITPLKPSERQREWFEERLKDIEETVIKAANAIQKNENGASFTKLITQVLALHEQILSLQISLMIVPSVESVLENLAADPPNLVDYYSTTLLLKNLFLQMTELKKQCLQPILELLCYIRTTPSIPKETYSKMRIELKELARLTQLLCNPLTSEEICRDLIQEAQQLGQRARSLMKNVLLADLPYQIEEMEYRRLVDFFATHNETNFINAFYWDPNSLIFTLNIITNFKPRGYHDYLLLRALINGINTAQHFWYKFSPEDKENIFQNLKALAENALLFFENRRRKHKKFSESMENLSRQAIQDFNQHYRDLIAISQKYATAEK